MNKSQILVCAHLYSASIMDTALPQKFPFILDRNLAKANCTENKVCTSCDIVVLDLNIMLSVYQKSEIIIILEFIELSFIQVFLTFLVN